MKGSLVFVMLLLAVWAAPPPFVQEASAAAPGKLSKKQLQERRFRALMSQAKLAAKKGKHAAAIALYDKALAIHPGHLPALTDQGWSAFLINDIERAERLTREALDAEGYYAYYRISAAARYNLGRILEAKNERAGAIAAYKESLGMRPNRVVREQLGKLDPATAAAADPLRPQPMLGPFVTLADFCRTREGDERTYCPSPDGGELAQVGTPYQTVTWIMAGKPDSAHCHIAVQLTNKAWFVERQGAICRNGGDLDRKVLSFEVADLVPGGNREVVLRVADRLSEVDFDKADDMGASIVEKECLGWLTACGVGPTGVPSCLRMQFARADACGMEFQHPWDWQLEPVFSGGEVEVKGTGALDADAHALMGRRQLAFP